MRDVAAIDRQLRDLASTRRLFVEMGSSATTRAEIDGQVDDLLDERNQLSQGH